MVDTHKSHGTQYYASNQEGVNPGMLLCKSGFYRIRHICEFIARINLLFRVKSCESYSRVYASNTKSLKLVSQSKIRSKAHRYIKIKSEQEINIRILKIVLEIKFSFIFFIPCYSSYIDISQRSSVFYSFVINNVFN